MIKIDCFGDICPIPILKLQAQLKKISDGESFTLIVDHSCVKESIEDLYSTSSHKIFFDEVINGVWEITVTKNVH